MTLAASSSGALSLNISQMINSEGGGGGGRGLSSSAANAAAAINLSAAGSAASSQLSAGGSGGLADVAPSMGSSASETMRFVSYRVRRVVATRDLDWGVNCFLVCMSSLTCWGSAARQD